jgi:hypothetical protein
LAQPAASVQHFAHAAGSLQQLPSHDMAVLVLPMSLWQVQQPVDRKIPAAQTAAKAIMVFIV